MGERGPPPKLHARRRNKRPNRGKKIDVVAPEPPADLEGEALEEWERIVPEIEAMGILATLDRAALIRYCRMWADWYAIDEKFRQTGLLVTGQKKTLVRNPLWFMRLDVENSILELGKQLGLTPAARMRQGVEHVVEEQPSQAGVTALEDYRKVLEG